MSRVGIRKVAEQAGVSVGTVSKILNPGSSANIRVSEKTRAKVEKAVAELNYQPTYGAKLLRGESSQTIGFAVSLPEDHNFAYLSSYTFRLLNGIGKAAGEHGYQVLLLNGVDYSHFLDVKRLDALIINGFAPVSNPRAAEMNALYNHFMENKYPFAVINGHCGKTFPEIAVDNDFGMKLTANLIRKRGFKNIGFIGELTDNPQQDHQDRLLFLKKHLAKTGIDLPEKHIIAKAGKDVPNLPRTGQYSELDGYTALEILNRRHAIPRCLVCGNDTIALGVIKRAAELHLRIPEDLALIGFDDEPQLNYIQPGLTTIHHPVEELGKAAVEYVLSKRKDPDLMLSQKIKPTLVERGSI